MQARSRELEQRNREQSEALERERATGEVLCVIADAPADLQPVLDTIVESGARLCGAENVTLRMVEGDDSVLCARYGAKTIHLRLGFRAALAADRTSMSGRAIREHRTFQIPNIALADPDEWSDAIRLLRRDGHQAGISVPLLRSGSAIGVITVLRHDPTDFTDRQVDLLETFADQAVIAIENARLFEELQQRNRDLTEALEQQTALADILKVISSSPADVQTVLDAIVQRARTLGDADSASINGIEGDEMVRWATTTHRPLGHRVPLSDPRIFAPIALRERRTVHIEDSGRLLSGAGDQYGDVFGAPGARPPGSAVLVPLMRDGATLAILGVTRDQVRPFTDKQIALLETFADQAVIAIENARLFDELQQSNQELEAASRAKSEFLSRMSHELRTPLNAIIGFGEIMEMDPATTIKQHERVGHILRGGRHLLGLINEVLDIARIEAGRLSLSLEPVALDAVLGEVLDLIRPIAVEADVKLQLAEPPSIDSAVLADRERLRQIILNLVTNGVKYNHPRGSVSVGVGSGERGAGAAGSAITGDGEISTARAETGSSRPAPPSVRLTVSDTGPGLSAEQSSRLFAPFERLSADQSGVEGTGLGLAIAKRLAQAMGGDIGVESVVGQGSVFWLDLPAATLPLGFLAGPEDEAHLPAANEAAAAATVLYIEDNLPNVELVQHILGFRPGVTLLTAPRAEVGLRLAHRYQPDLILLDLNLPDFQGDEVLARLRAEPRTAAIPVVMISADATENQVQRLLASGARDYLTKPLARIIHQAPRHRRMSIATRGASLAVIAR